MPQWLTEMLPIVVLLTVCVLVVARLPKIDLGHSPAFVRRRFWNWFPLGLTYAFLYMGRYNLNVAKTAFGDTLSKQQFGDIFAWGALVYGVAFLINGPLADRLGGRATILAAAAGSAVCNVLMGLVIWFQWTDHLPLKFSVLYAANMYFQSFGAVSIVKVNAAWFHVRERGTFGGIFGILISLGLYFAYEWGEIIVENLPVQWVFFIPAAILTAFFALDFALVRDQPSQVGLQDIPTGDATEDGPALPLFQIAAKMLTNRTILVIALVEFCSGYLRNGVLQWGLPFGKETGQAHGFVFDNWGVLMCLAGITGGMVAGLISDRLFASRRGPVSAVLYGGMVLGAIGLYATLSTPLAGWMLVGMSVCIIGVHGMLSGTASMDFGGRKNAGVAVGIIDGFVYLGSSLQGKVFGWALPTGEAQKDPANWASWPLALLPAAVVGLALATSLWNATAKKGGGAH